MRFMSQRLLLAIESSCDDTSLAVLNMAGKLIYKIQDSQKNIHKPFWGVVPQLAAYGHKRSLLDFSRDQFLRRILKNNLVKFIAVTSGPGIGACLNAGYEYASFISNTFNIPLIGVNHLHGHLSSILSCQTNILYPHLSLLISGGNTQLILSQKPGTYRILGQTIDDAVGEALDKIARNICTEWSSSGGLGKALESLAKQGRAVPFSIRNLDLVQNPLNFSFSGVKTALNEFIKTNKNAVAKEDLAATVQSVLFTQLISRVRVCLDVLDSCSVDIKQLSIIGGVASNQYLRDLITKLSQERNLKLVIPSIEICTDNAHMIGLAALSLLRESKGLKSMNNAIRPVQEWNVEELDISKCVIE